MRIVNDFYQEKNRSILKNMSCSHPKFLNLSVKNIFRWQIKENLFRSLQLDISAMVNILY